jgi:hypothetical protein
LAGCGRAPACSPWLGRRGRRPGGRRPAAPRCRSRAPHAPVPWPASPSPRLHPGQGPPRRPEALEAEHRVCPALDAAVVLLDPVVQPAAAPMGGEPPQPALALHLPQGARVALQPVGDDGARVADVLAGERLPEEALGGLLVPRGAEQEVDRLPRAVDRSVQVAPGTPDPDAGPVDVPRPAAGAEVPSQPLLRLGREAPRTQPPVAWRRFVREQPGAATPRRFRVRVNRASTLPGRMDAAILGCEWP